MTRGNETEYSDMSNFLNEKLGVFKTSVTLGSAGTHVLPIDLYQLGSIFVGNREVDQLTESEFSIIYGKIYSSYFGERITYEVITEVPTDKQFEHSY